MVLSSKVPERERKKLESSRLSEKKMRKMLTYAHWQRISDNEKSFALYVCRTRNISLYTAHISCRTYVVNCWNKPYPYVEIKQFLLEVLFNYYEVKDACLLAGALYK